MIDEVSKFKEKTELDPDSADSVHKSASCNSTHPLLLQALPCPCIIAQAIVQQLFLSLKEPTIISLVIVERLLIYTS